MTTGTKSAEVHRLDVLDALRGFALLGILIINSMSILAVKGSTPAFSVSIPAADRFLQDAVLFFVESKFFTIFSLLFGISFAIQIQSAERQGTQFLPRITRRLLALLIFGLLHIVLLWDGDILVIYALTGALLIAFRKTSFVRLRRWIIGLLAVPSVAVFLGFLWTLLARRSTSGAEMLARSDESLRVSFADTSATEKLLTNGYLETVADRIHTYLDLSPLLLSRIPTVLAMFLLGLYLGRSKIVWDLDNYRSLLGRVRFWGLLSGFSLMALIVASTKLLPATSALVAIIEDQYLAGPILCLGYAATFVLAYQRNPDSRVFRLLSPVGQMALTNYLMQSLVMTGIAYGWGFGRALTLSGFQVLGLALCLFLAQVMLSRLWLSFFKYGPMEWVWRCATYWRIVPIRKHASHSG